jgi:membrane protein implicated in regulation of membrane protease activity
MQGILVALIVALAAAYLVRRFYRSYKAASGQARSNEGCGCGCSGCEVAGTCSAGDLDGH